MENVGFLCGGFRTVMKILFPQNKNPEKVHAFMKPALAEKGSSYPTKKKRCAKFQRVDS